MSKKKKRKVKVENVASEKTWDADSLDELKQASKEKWDEDQPVTDPVHDAARIRQTQLKAQHKPDVVKPKRKFEFGQLVSISEPSFYKKFGTTNGIVCGYEWGGDHRNFMCEEWLYYVRQESGGFESVLIVESDLGRISV